MLWHPINRSTPDPGVRWGGEGIGQRRLSRKRPLRAPPVNLVRVRPELVSDLGWSCMNKKQQTLRARMKLMDLGQTESQTSVVCHQTEESVIPCRTAKWQALEVLSQEKREAIEHFYVGQWHGMICISNRSLRLYSWGETGEGKSRWRRMP